MLGLSSPLVCDKTVQKLSVIPFQIPLVLLILWVDMPLECAAEGPTSYTHKQVSHAYELSCTALEATLLGRVTACHMSSCNVRLLAAHSYAGGRCQGGGGGETSAAVS